VLEERLGSSLKVVGGIPAFNEERTIAKVIVRSKRHVDRVLVVDDGSKDDTASIAQNLGATVIRHEKNLGKGAAIHDCFEWAKRIGADVLVTLDGDGQHDPSFIPTLVDALRKTRADVVIGSRKTRPTDMPRYRWLGERALDLATQVKIGERIVDAQSGFRAYSRRAIENLVAAEYGMGVDSEVIMRAHRAGMKIVEVPITARYAGLKSSSHNPVMHGLDVVFSLVKFVSIGHPLLFYGGFAAASLIVSFVFGYMTIDYYQRWGRVITNLALISVASGIVGLLALFTGVILFTLITVVREKR
jgi:glycosyltransferase involved in cell wall biosynthesis